MMEQSPSYGSTSSLMTFPTLLFFEKLERVSFSNGLWRFEKDLQYFKEDIKSLCYFVLAKPSLMIYICTLILNYFFQSNYNQQTLLEGIEWRNPLFNRLTKSICGQLLPDRSFYLYSVMAERFEINECDLLFTSMPYRQNINPPACWPEIWGLVMPHYVCGWGWLSVLTLMMEPWWWRDSDGWQGMRKKGTHGKLLWLSSPIPSFLLFSNSNQLLIYSYHSSMKRLTCWCLPSHG